MNTACRNCKTTNIMPFLNLGMTPLADQFQVDPSEVQEFYPLQIAYCLDCSLVQQLYDVDDAILFGADYGFFTGASPALRTHFREYAAYVIDRYPEQCKRGVLEVASNDGELLQHFHAAGYDVLGIDPAGPPTEAAKAKGLPTWTEPFISSGMDNVKAGIILANNVLAHVRDPQDFMLAISNILTDDGVAILEFQYLGDLLVGNAWDLFYHEHRSFLSLSAVDAMARQHGLFLNSAVGVDTQGGSMRVELKHSGNLVEDLTEAWLKNPDTYETMQGRVDFSVDRLRMVCDKFDNISGYAASAKATTLLHYTSINLDYVVDTTPSKIGKYMPGTAIPIVERGPRTNAVLLLARNYLPRYLQTEREFIAIGGKTIIPLPLAEVI